MRIAADGYIDLTDGRRVRTPGIHEPGVEPLPEAEALSFLLSHSFRGHRKVVRPLGIRECKRIRLAIFSDSVSERMGHVDRVWRSITEPVAPTRLDGKPELIQVIRLGEWAYPLHLDGDFTRVIPIQGIPANDVSPEKVTDFDRLTA